MLDVSRTREWVKEKIAFKPMAFFPPPLSFFLFSLRLAAAVLREDDWRWCARRAVKVKKDCGSRWRVPPPPSSLSSLFSLLTGCAGLGALHRRERASQAIRALAAKVR